MLFSIIIPTYNNLPELKACLGALALLAIRDFEVWVGVDGSTDGTWEWLNETDFGFPCKALQHPGGINQGRSATRNLALPYLRGRYTLFLDSDMLSSPDLLAAHQAVLDKGAVSIGAVHYRNAEDNLWVAYTSSRGVAKYPGGAEVPFHYFITPNTALPTDWLQALEGFDPAISRYGGEDMELGYRIHRRFHPPYVFNRLAVVETTQPKQLADALHQLREYGATGLRYITRKWPELSTIYWVSRCHSRRWKDRMFEGLTRPPFRNMAQAMVRFSPRALQHMLISYLVISYVHEGYRTGKF
jgi:glycosyltransferase involved in cell wall biosynthesis